MRFIMGVGNELVRNGSCGYFTLLETKSQTQSPRDRVGFKNYLYFAGFLIALCWMWLQARDRKRRPGEPPLVKGLPFLGCSREFARNSVKFCLDLRAKLGDVFTLTLPFVHLHLLMNPHILSHFARHHDLSFDPIQRMVNQNVFQFRLFDAKRTMKQAAHSGRFTTGIPDTFSQFLQYVNEGLQSIDTGKTFSLTDTLRSVQFRAIYNSIFGNMDKEKLNYLGASRHFQTFHKYFNFLWLGFPLWLFPQAKHALNSLISAFPQAQYLLEKPDLSEYMRQVLSRMLQAGQSHADIVGHNLVYLHVNCNTVKSTFWMLCHLLNNPPALESVQNEIRQLVDSSVDEEGEATLTVKQVDSLHILNSVVLETFRMCSGVLMVREVEKDTELLTDANTGHFVKLRKGDRVALYPPALHHDPEIFDQPQVFQYLRFVGGEFSFRGQPLRSPVLAFGTLCPGQRLALLQMKLTVIALLANYHISYAEGHGLPPCDLTSQGHEIVSPQHDVSFEIKPLRNGNSFYRISLLA